MPFGNGTGPAGMGPMTGRAAGYCAGFGVPGYMNPTPGGGYWGWGRGRGGGRGFWGRGGGRGWRNWYYATGLTGWQRAATGWPVWGGYAPRAAGWAAPFGPGVTKDQELEALKAQADQMEDALKSVRQQIDQLQTSSEQTAE